MQTDFKVLEDEKYSENSQRVNKLETALFHKLPRKHIKFNPDGSRFEFFRQLIQ